jgi:hypothetical protein
LSVVLRGRDRVLRWRSRTADAETDGLAGADECLGRGTAKGKTWVIIGAMGVLEMTGTTCVTVTDV